MWTSDPAGNPTGRDGTGHRSLHAHQVLPLAIVGIVLGAALGSTVTTLAASLIAMACLGREAMAAHR